MTRQRVRVLHVVQSLNWGGMERVVSDLITHTNADRFEQHLLCLQYLGRFSEGLEKVATLHVAEPMSRLSLVNPRTLARQIARIAPDVVHTHSGVWYKTSLAARRAGVRRLVHTEHGRRTPDPWSDRLLDGAAARRTDVVVAVSDRLARALPRALRVRTAKVVCIPNGVDTRLYRPVPDTGVLRHELGLSASTVVIGSIGRLEPVKAYDGMVDAFADFARRPAGREAVLVVAGEGSTRDALDAQIARRGLSGRVHLLGWRSDINDLLSAFTIFSMSSMSEGTSISLLEAMSMGLPPVVTDVGGNADVLGPSLSSGLVPFGNSTALADAWETNLAGRETASQAARARVLGGFDLDAVAAAYERVYLTHAGEPAGAIDASPRARMAT